MFAIKLKFYSGFISNSREFEKYLIVLYICKDIYVSMCMRNSISRFKCIFNYIVKDIELNDGRNSWHSMLISHT